MLSNRGLQAVFSLGFLRGDFQLMREFTVEETLISRRPTRGVNSSSMTGSRLARFPFVPLPSLPLALVSDTHR